MHRLWRDHSKTIVGLTTGTAIVASSRWLWPDGGVDFDLVTILVAIQLNDGLDGVKNRFWTEVNKPEDWCPVLTPEAEAYRKLYKDPRRCGPHGIRRQALKRVFGWRRDARHLPRRGA